MIATDTVYFTNWNNLPWMRSINIVYLFHLFGDLRREARVSRGFILRSFSNILSAVLTIRWQLFLAIIRAYRESYLVAETPSSPADCISRSIPWWPPLPPTLAWRSSSLCGHLGVFLFLSLSLCMAASLLLSPSRTSVDRSSGSYQPYPNRPNLVEP